MDKGLIKACKGSIKKWENILEDGQEEFEKDPSNITRICAICSYADSKSNYTLLNGDTYCCVCPLYNIENRTPCFAEGLYKDIYNLIDELATCGTLAYDFDVNQNRIDALWNDIVAYSAELIEKLTKIIEEEQSKV